MNRVERIVHYTATPSEAPLIIDDCRVPSGWPFEGKIVFNNLSMQYRQDLPPVLKVKKQKKNKNHLHNFIFFSYFFLDFSLFFQEYFMYYKW